VQVGVFVSLVSTKIPFKGAGKEYIGGQGCDV
jgi:DNA topoisomerase VI subunit B